MQNGECSLQEAAFFQQNSIQADIVKKRNSLELLAQLLDNGAELSFFDTDYYWNIIERREKEGKKITDIEDVYACHPVSMGCKLICPSIGKNWNRSWKISYMTKVARKKKMEWDWILFTALTVVTIWCAILVRNKFVHRDEFVNIT